MAYTYSKIASVTVGSGGSSSIDFIAIPQNYTDLVVKLSGRSISGFVGYMKLNNSTSNLSRRNLFGDGSTAFSGTGTDIAYYVTPGDYTANTFGNVEIYIPNYTSSYYKSISIDAVMENNATLARMFLGANLWSDSSMITSLSFYLASGNFAQYSTATLYGIKAEL